MGIPDFHVRVKRRRKQGGDNVDEDYGNDDFNEVKNFIEKKLREFQHSEEERIVINLEEIK